MCEIQLLKFSQHAVLKQALIDTGDSRLVYAQSLDTKTQRTEEMLSLMSSGGTTFYHELYAPTCCCLTTLSGVLIRIRTQMARTTTEAMPCKSWSVSHRVYITAVSKTDWSLHSSVGGY